jgi:hypothetical protein
VVLKPGVAKNFQCVAKIENILNYQKQSITAITLKVFADGDLLTALMLSVFLCSKEIILPLDAFLSPLMGSIKCVK